MSYKLNVFLQDISPILPFSILKKLEANGFENTIGDDYVVDGPQFLRRQFKLADERARILISAGLPESARMEDIADFLTTKIEIDNRDHVIACVNQILQNVQNV